MAWIESDQSLRTDPRTKRLARRLGVPLAQAIGHLHLLWWWCLDHAFNGDLTPFDDEDVADAADWSDDPTCLVGALQAAGFLDHDRRLNGWSDKTERLRRAREKSLKANHSRWHGQYGRTDPNCVYCETSLPTDSQRTPKAIYRESTDQTDRTEQTDPPPPPDADGVADKVGEVVAAVLDKVATRAGPTLATHLRRSTTTTKLRPRLAELAGLGWTAKQLLDAVRLDNLPDPVDDLPSLLATRLDGQTDPPRPKRVDQPDCPTCANGWIAHGAAAHRCPDCNGGERCDECAPPVEAVA